METLTKHLCRLLEETTGLQCCLREGRRSELRGALVQILMDKRLWPILGQSGSICFGLLNREKPATAWRFMHLGQHGLDGVFWSRLAIGLSAIPNRCVQPLSEMMEVYPLETLMAAQGETLVDLMLDCGFDAKRITKELRRHLKARAQRLRRQKRD